jgi:hypothetical protein
MMNFRTIRMASVINGLTAGISGGVAAVIQQGVGNISGGSLLSVALSGAAGTYVAVMIDLIRQWFSKRWRNHQLVFRSSSVEDLNKGDVA